MIAESIDLRAIRVRITSGHLRNRQFEVPHSEVRPTMEAVREALFSSLGGQCNGLRVLDLYAGSGALGLEAWSRGAASVTFVEKHSKVMKQIEQNVEQLRLPELGTAQVYCADAVRWVREVKISFDLILVDPPYDCTEAFEETLSAIESASALTADGFVVYEMRSTQEWSLPLGWSVKRDKRYGKTRVLILNQEQR